MKSRLRLFGVLVFALALMFLVGCAPKKYIPKPNEVIYGTWTNEKMSPPKMVQTPEGYHDYASISDTTPIVAGPEKLFNSWTDLAGC